MPERHDRAWGQSLRLWGQSLGDPKPGATSEEIAAKVQKGIDQLRRYAVDPFVPALAAGTRLHCLLYHFQGTELIRAEEIAV